VLESGPPGYAVNTKYVYVQMVKTRLRCRLGYIRGDITAED
jgi:hypothetical protein